MSTCTSRCHDVGEPYLLPTYHSTLDDYAHSHLHYFSNVASGPSPKSGVEIDGPGGHKLSIGLSLTLVFTPKPPEDPHHPFARPPGQRASEPPQHAPTCATPTWKHKTNLVLHSVVDITPIVFPPNGVTTPMARTAVVTGATQCVLSMTVGALCLPHVVS